MSTTQNACESIQVTASMAGRLPSLSVRVLYGTYRKPCVTPELNIE